MNCNALYWNILNKQYTIINYVSIIILIKFKLFFCTNSLHFYYYFLILYHFFCLYSSLRLCFLRKSFWFLSLPDFLYIKPWILSCAPYFLLLTLVNFSWFLLIFLSFQECGECLNMTLLVCLIGIDLIPVIFGQPLCF